MTLVKANVSKMVPHTRLGTEYFNRTGFPKGAISSDAIELSKLNWEVKKCPIFLINEDKRAEPIKNYQAVVRSDTQQCLGIVGKRYQPFQNVEAFQFLDSVVPEFSAEYYNAGSLHGGKKIFIQLRIPSVKIEPVKNDVTDSFVTLINSHDGTSLIHCFPTTVRIVCINTFRCALQGKHKGISLKHTKHIRHQIQAARNALSQCISSLTHYKELSESLCKEFFPNPYQYFTNILDKVYPLPQVENDHDKQLQRITNKRAKIYNDLLNRYESPTNGVSGIRGTKWAAFQTIIESIDHGILGQSFRGNDQGSKWFESSLVGQNDDLKQIALTEILQLSA